MENNKKNNRVIVGLLLGIIIMLVVFVILFATNTISFTSKATTNESGTTNTEENNTLSNEEALSIGKELYDKAVEAQIVSGTLPYCGYSRDEILKMKTTDFGLSNKSLSYYETDYKNLDELKTSLKKYFNDEIIYLVTFKDSIPVTDVKVLENEGSENEPFVIYNNKLYCRSHEGKGYLHFYIGEYDITIDNIEVNKITYNIKSAYVKDGPNNTRCISPNYSNCTEDDKEYKDTKFIIEKNNDNWVISEYTMFGYDAKEEATTLK